MSSLCAVFDVRTQSGCRQAFDRLLEMSDDELGQQDIALVNLVCAGGLPGTENMDIPQCLAIIEEWTERVRSETEKGFARYRANPNPNKGSEAVYRLWWVLYTLRFRIGLTHRMTAERKASNAKDLRINGATAPRSRD